MDSASNYNPLEGIAIIGMAGRFPGAKNITEFWQNLQDGVESVTTFTDAELVAAGVDPNLLSNPNYVKAGAVLEDIDLFDANFFGVNPKEAEITDPQHRLFLECAWEALENAGYNSTQCESRIGVYGGAGFSSYLSFNTKEEDVEFAIAFQKLIGNDKDFLTTRVSYKLNLSGPSITVQTACSTSLVAVSLACQSLLNYQCDIALAGGVSIRVPQKTGYLYQEGGILSPDGHCRAFDAKARGTIIGNGVGIIVLKRLEDAIADRDNIYAVIKATAINNDGSGKVGYTAPSVNGQTEAVAEAITLAGVEPETISYIEAHGTGTSLGDPIEIAALTNVFNAITDKKGFCAVGSVKTNIGHLDAAAGVTGVIKTALALKHKLIPPSLNFEQPNPQIDFANTPFYVNTALKEWSTAPIPRRAGVSSLGIGGTNAHVILEEAPVIRKIEEQGRDYELLVISAKTNSALETATHNLAQYLKHHPELNLADVAYTLQVGRAAFNHRRILVCQNTQAAITALETVNPQQVFTQHQKPIQYSLTFMFPGQGSQYSEMGKELYQSEPLFREQVDNCCSILEQHLGLDLRSLIFPHESAKAAATEKLKQTSIAQPALFVIEYALAQLWMSWGITPEAMIGHSIGEYVAACLAGVMSVEDALALVAIRGQLMQKMPTGAMLSVSLPEGQIKGFLNENLSLAVINAPCLCVVAGSHDAVEQLHEQLTATGIECRYLHTSHAFHSHMMESCLDSFIAEAKKVKLNPPQIPFISNLTGTWITAEEATNPNYWAQHLRNTVRFSAGVSVLLQNSDRILLEVGPGRTLCSLVKQHYLQAEEQTVLPSLRHPQEEKSDVSFLLQTLGKLWLAGVEINWSDFYAHQQRYRVPLPTYPFERQRYWLETQAPAQLRRIESQSGKKPNIADWFYVPSWKRVPLISSKNINGCCLVFVDECGLGSQLTQKLSQSAQVVITVKQGKQFQQIDSNTYTINPNQADDYTHLLQNLQEQLKSPDTIIHLWDVAQPLPLSAENIQNLGFYSLVYLAQALGQQLNNPIQLLVATNYLYEITGNEEISPEKATIVGICKVIPQEYSQISCRLVDISLPISKNLVEQLIAELTTPSENSIIAYRNNYRWVQTFEPIALEKAAENNLRLRQGGVYLITGGLGSIGLVLAEYLAQTVQAKLILLGRSIPSENSSKMQKIKQLEALGSEVLVLTADVTNYQQMQSAIATSLERFSSIHGVIHAAGIAGGGIIQLKTPETIEQVFAPKIKGTLVLNKVLKNINLDFWILCSSLSSIQGGFGQSDYCAANAFLDAFAHWNTSKNQQLTVAINWDTWQEVGMAVSTTVPAAFKKWQEESLKNGILSTEGVEVFSRILGSSLSQVLVSTQDLQVGIEHINQLIASKPFNLNSVNSDQEPAITYSHSLSDSIYIAPDSETERLIADIWQELIGVQKIGIYDNFFELGGHSLLAVQVISRLQETFGVELSMRTLLVDAPTIAELASVIDEKQLQDESMDQLLTEIENISFEELQKQLTQSQVSH